MTQSEKREVDDENVIYIFVNVCLRYGGRRFSTSLKSFVITAVLHDYVNGCTIIDYQT